MKCFSLIHEELMRSEKYGRFALPPRAQLADRLPSLVEVHATASGSKAVGFSALIETAYI
jgi:hypothetical protein